MGPGRARGVEPSHMIADYGEASSLSAISSNLVTLFQFLPVPDVFSVFSMTGHDDATGSGPKHRAGFRADPWRRRSFPARQAGGQLPGTNSTRRKFGRAAETGRDH